MLDSDEGGTDTGGADAASGGGDGARGGSCSRSDQAYSFIDILLYQQAMLVTINYPRFAGEGVLSMEWWPCLGEGIYMIDVISSIPVFRGGGSVLFLCCFFRSILGRV